MANLPVAAVVALECKTPWRLQKRYKTAVIDSRYSPSENDFAVHDFVKRVTATEQTCS
jgi:hypothetical protein